MLKIKLIPVGKKHAIEYRIGVCPDHSKITGAQVAYLGYYRPKTSELVVDQEALSKWQKQGAQVTTGLSKLLSTWKTSSNS